MSQIDPGKHLFSRGFCISPSSNCTQKNLFAVVVGCSPNRGAAACRVLYISATTSPDHAARHPRTVAGIPCSPRRSTAPVGAFVLPDSDYRQMRRADGPAKPAVPSAVIVRHIVAGRFMGRVKTPFWTVTPRSVWPSGVQVPDHEPDSNSARWLRASPWR